MLLLLLGQSNRKMIFVRHNLNFNQIKLSQTTKGEGDIDSVMRSSLFILHCQSRFNMPVPNFVNLYSKIYNRFEFGTHRFAGCRLFFK